MGRDSGRLGLSRVRHGQKRLRHGRDVEGSRATRMRLPSAIAFPGYLPHWKAEMQLSRFVGMLIRATNELRTSKWRGHDEGGSWYYRRIRHLRPGRAGER